MRICTRGRKFTSRCRVDRPRPDIWLLAGEGHIPLAATRRRSSAAPITGTHGEAEATSRSICVSSAFAKRQRRPSHTARRVAGDTGGRACRGREADRGATCGSAWAGSRPLSRSTRARRPEWNTAALGPTKRDYADKLARRLRGRFAVGGLLHYGQGKWYPMLRRRRGGRWDILAGGRRAAVA